METLTVRELIDKLQKMPKRAKVFMVTNKSDENWDEDAGNWKQVHGIEYVTEETIYSDNGLDTETERNVLLEIETE